MDPRGKVTGSLENLRQQGEHGWRVSFLGGRLTGRQADLPLGHRQTRDRIHDQQHVGALVPEVFGDGQRREAGPYPQWRRTVRSGDHHHRPAHTRRTHLVLQEGAHFAIALPYQRDHGYIRRVVAGQAPQ
jgi:hypothetical protein